MSRSLLIVFGSETGTAQDVAENLRREALQRRIAVRICAFDDCDVDVCFVFSRSYCYLWRPAECTAIANLFPYDRLHCRLMESNCVPNYLYRPLDSLFLTLFLMEGIHFWDPPFSPLLDVSFRDGNRLCGFDDRSGRVSTEHARSVETSPAQITYINVSLFGWLLYCFSAYIFLNPLFEDNRLETSTSFVFYL